MRVSHFCEHEPGGRGRDEAKGMTVERRAISAVYCEGDENARFKRPGDWYAARERLLAGIARKAPGSAVKGGVDGAGKALLRQASPAAGISRRRKGGVQA